jgi:hypothetical protein
MMDLKQLKIRILKEDDDMLTIEEINRLLNSSVEPKEKWFYRGLKHMYENHYAEAIKWFQLVNDDLSRYLIYLTAFKLKDEFIMQEYKTDVEKLDLKLKPVFVYRDRIIYPKEIVK